MYMKCSVYGIKNPVLYTDYGELFPRKFKGLLQN